MSVELLDKTRKIDKLLHNTEASKVVFTDVCTVLESVLQSNVLVISKKGKVLGVSEVDGMAPLGELLASKEGAFIDLKLNGRFLNILSTKENVNLETLGFSPEAANHYHAIVTPITVAKERLGTIFLYKNDAEYTIDDIILCEYGTMVVGLEMMRSVYEENVEEERKQHDVKSAIDTLSLLEKRAIVSLLDELDGIEGIVVASRIADKVGITRSVVVNALRKFESAGIIESRSAGMKGTYIKVLNEKVFEALRKLKEDKA